MGRKNGLRKVENAIPPAKRMTPTMIVKRQGKPADFFVIFSINF